MWLWPWIWERGVGLGLDTCGFVTHTRLTAFFRDYPGEPVPER